MSEFIVKVGRKGELYTPKKLRVEADITPGSEFNARIENDEIILRKRKKLSELLEENAVITIGVDEVKSERSSLEQELLERE